MPLTPRAAVDSVLDTLEMSLIPEEKALESALGVGEVSPHGGVTRLFLKPRRRTGSGLERSGTHGGRVRRLRGPSFRFWPRPVLPFLAAVPAAVGAARHLCSSGHLVFSRRLAQHLESPHTPHLSLPSPVRGLTQAPPHPRFTPFSLR